MKSFLIKMGNTLRFFMHRQNTTEKVRLHSSLELSIGTFFFRNENKVVIDKTYITIEK